MEYISEKDERKLAYYFERYSMGLHFAVKERLGKFFHDNAGQQVAPVYICPLCLHNKISVLENVIRSDDEFDLDHFPPKSVGGTATVLVCKNCNSNAGSNIDYSVKDWLQLQAFGAKVPNSKISAKIKLNEVKGNYKGNILMTKDKSFSIDDFDRYPLFSKRMKEMLDGNTVNSSWDFSKLDQTHVSRALIKAAYLYSFCVWGYDFAYTATGHRLRQIIQGKELHPLKNSGIFYQMDGIYPPEGICMVIEPEHLQSFIVNLKLTVKEIGYTCGVSVIIPGGYNEWNNIYHYQPIVESDKFQHKEIKVPEDTLTKEQVFPFTSFWENRKNIKLATDVD